MKAFLVETATMAGGALAERIEDAIREVVDNIIDPNTKPEIKRVITAKISLKPTADRRAASVEIDVATKIAPPAPVQTQFHIGREGGAPVAYENDPLQQHMDFEIKEGGE